jgi:hypothetical protein
MMIILTVSKKIYKTCVEQSWDNFKEDQNDRWSFIQKEAKKEGSFIKYWRNKKAELEILVKEKLFFTV